MMIRQTPLAAYLCAVSCLTTLLLTSALQAAKYSKAEVTRVFNDVRILKSDTTYRQAEVGAEVSAVSSVATGADSRVELRFPDKSLTRLGANSRFTLRGEGRTLDLEQGTMLLQVPKRIGGAKVRTAAVTAAVTGTSVLFEFLAGGFLKLIVIEGTVDLFFNSNPGQFTTVKAGEMIIMKVDAKVLPLPVDVDLERLLKTSKLISADDEGIVNKEQVVQALQTQQQELQKGDLVQTSLVIPGQGTLVQVESNVALNVVKAVTIRESASPPPGGSPAPGTEGPGTEKPGTEKPGTEDPPTEPAPAPGNTLISVVINETSTIVTNPTTTAFNAATGAAATVTGRTYNGSATDGLFSPFAFGVGGSPNYPTFQEALDEATTPWATFTFKSIDINGNPTFTVPEGPNPARNVVLGADGDIRLGGNVLTPPGTSGGLQLDLTANPDPLLDSLAFYSNMGSIFVGPDFEISAGTEDSFQDLFFVAAGPTSNVHIQGETVIWGRLHLGAFQDVLIGPTSDSFEPSDALLYPVFLDAEAHRDIIVDNAGVRADNTIELIAGRNLEVKSDPTAGARGMLMADGWQVPAMVNLKAEAGNLTIERYDVSAGDDNGFGGSVDLAANNHVELSDTTIQADTNIMISSTLGNITIQSSEEPASARGTLIAVGLEGPAIVNVKAEAGDLTIERSDIRAGGEGNESGGSVDLAASKHVELSDTTVQSETKTMVSSSLGHITIQNSSQLRILANTMPLFNPDGSVAEPSLHLRAEAGDVNVVGDAISHSEENPTLQAPNILLEAFNNIRLTNVHASADILRAQTLGPNGALIIGGGHLNASQLLRLYAEGSNGMVHFIENTVLSGAQVDIAGKRVQVDSGKSVNVNSYNLNIFSDDHRYNDEQHGQINGYLNRQSSFDQRPDFSDGPEPGGGAS